jgi:hypothetical protein
MARQRLLSKVDLEEFARNVGIVQPAASMTAIREAKRRRMIPVARLKPIRAARMEPAAGRW